MSQKAYAAAGVDIDLGNRVKATLPQCSLPPAAARCWARSAAFGGLFALDVKKFRQPVLVSSTDGVGTKLKIAFAMNRHDTVGQDLGQSLRQ
jgi:phosphoribosylformylglycinamidine cyclo-ligase